MFKGGIVILGCVFCLAGCSIYKIDSQDSTLDFYPPKPSVEQVIYLDKVEKPYEIIGMVTATTDRTRPLQEVIDKMREEAAILGGDAIIDVHMVSAPRATPNGKKYFFQDDGVLVRYSAKVIIFK